MILVGIDPGSAHLGLVVVDARAYAVEGAPDCGALPVRVVLVADTLAVDPAHLGAIVNEILDVAVSVGAGALVVEHAPWFPPGGASPGGLKVSHDNWLVTHDLLDALRRESPIPVHVIARQTWAHRVVPHHRGGVTDADVTRALPALLDPASLALLTDTHQRDAAGAVLGYLLAPAPKYTKEPRPPCACCGEAFAMPHNCRKGEGRCACATHPGGPPKPRPPRKAKRRAGKNDAWIARRSQARLEARRARGCTCAPGAAKCPRSCPGFRASPRKGHVRGLACPPVAG
jgi:hypothetical protein